MRLWFAGIAIIFHIETGYKKRHALAQHLLGPSGQPANWFLCGKVYFSVFVSAHIAHTVLPATGEATQIKAKRVVKFRVAKAAKDAILGEK